MSLKEIFSYQQWKEDNELPSAHNRQIFGVLCGECASQVRVLYDAEKRNAIRAFSILGVFILIGIVIVAVL